jgi:hypothetical protein
MPQIYDWQKVDSNSNIYDVNEPIRYLKINLTNY